MAYDPVHSCWWKSERLTISGTTIRPAERTICEQYDPWDVYESVKGKYRTVTTLWGEFAEIVRQIRQGAVDRYTPSPKGRLLILNWSRKYGLLGLLPGKA